MIWGMFNALFLFTVPLAVCTYLLIGLLLKRGYLGAFESRKDLGSQLKASKKAHKKEIKKNYFLGKWLEFGGGFYGLTALYTYAWIEVGEVIQFIFKMLNPANWSFDIGIDLLVGLIINAITNLIDAFLWFWYWSTADTPLNIFIYVALAYLAYMAGSHYAQLHYKEDKGHMDYWRWWNNEMKGESENDRKDDDA